MQKTRERKMMNRDEIIKNYLLKNGHLPTAEQVDQIQRTFALSEQTTSQVTNLIPESVDIDQTQRTPVFPVLDNWKTNIGFSFLGVILMTIVSWSIYGITFIIGTASGSATKEFMALVYFTMHALSFVTTAIYALYIYPSYFTEKPKIKSNMLISFLNLAFGSVIFGPIWNTNLTKRKKGVSNIVLTIISGCTFLLVSIISH